MSMTLNDLNSTIKELVVQECDRAIGKMTTTEINGHVLATKAVSDYIESLDYFTKWDNVSSSSKGNIKTNFTTHTNAYGDPIGFIDTGLVFKKGKVGVLFFQGGISIRAMMEKSATSVSFDQLCNGIISDSGGYLLPGEEKFHIIEDLITLIVPAQKTMKEMSEIRKKLLASSNTAKTVFKNQYLKMTNSITACINNNKTDEAMKWAEYMCEYAKGNDTDTYVIPYSVIISLLMLQEKYDEAKSFAEENKLGEWVNIVTEKHNLYHQIKNREYYQQAKHYFNKNDCDNAIVNIRKALEEWSTIESWSLYLHIVNKFANADNMFLKSDYDRVMTVNENTADEQSQMLDSEKKLVEELKQRYEKYVDEISKLLSEKVNSGDLEFFQKNEGAACKLVDKWNMNALMYASLYKKYDMVEELIKYTDELDKTNILGHTYTDILIFTCNSKKEYTEHAYSTDKWYKSEKERVNRKIKNAERGSGFANFMGDMAAQTGSVDAAVSSANFSSSMENKKNEAIEEFNENVSDHYIEIHEKTWFSVFKYAFSGKGIKVELKKNPKKDELEKKKYEDERCAFVEDYLKKYLTERDEFETSAKYEERKQRIRKQGEDAFDEAHKSKTHSGLSEVVENPEECRSLAMIYLKSKFSLHATLGRYEADNEEFNFSCDGFLNKFEGTIKVPIDIAPEFKKKYCEEGFYLYPVQINVDSEKMCAECDIEFNSKLYKTVVCQNLNGMMKNFISSICSD